MAKFLRLTLASGQAIFVNTAHIAVFEPHVEYDKYTEKRVPEVKSRVFISGSTNWEHSEYPERICVRETALQIVAMLDNGGKDLLDD